MQFGKRTLSGLGVAVATTLLATGTLLLGAWLSSPAEVTQALGESGAVEVGMAVQSKFTETHSVNGIALGMLGALFTGTFVLGFLGLHKPIVHTGKGGLLVLKWTGIAAVGVLYAALRGAAGILWPPFVKKWMNRVDDAKCSAFDSATALGGMVIGGAGTIAGSVYTFVYALMSVFEPQNAPPAWPAIAWLSIVGVSILFTIIKKGKLGAVPGALWTFGTSAVYVVVRSLANIAWPPFMTSTPTFCSKRCEAKNDCNRFGATMLTSVFGTAALAIISLVYLIPPQGGFETFLETNGFGNAILFWLGAAVLGTCWKLGRVDWKQRAADAKAKADAAAQRKADYPDAPESLISDITDERSETVTYGRAAELVRRITRVQCDDDKKLAETHRALNHLANLLDEKDSVQDGPSERERRVLRDYQLPEERPNGA